MNTMPPHWLVIARGYLGIREVPGPGSNPTIVGFARRLAPWIRSFYTNDGIAWCGAFVAAMFAEARPAIPLPKNPLSALAWATWGVLLAEPCLGAVMVFKRPSGGHVAFYEGEDATHYHVLGGNQGDRVSVMRIEKSRCVAVRWPSGVEINAIGRVYLTAAGVRVSENEA